MGLSTQQTSGNPVYSIRVFQQGASVGQVSQSSRSEVRVLSLRRLTEAQALDPKGTPVALAPAVILSAIEHGSKGMIEAPKMRYHEDTGLVFVQGTADQQELVRQVLQNLEKDQEMLRNANAMRAQLEAQKDHAAREASRIKAQEEARKEKEGKQGDR
jgi:hypothetical protein